MKRRGAAIVRVRTPGLIVSRRAALVGGALLPFALLVSWHWTYPPLAAMSDYAQYILHAQALLDGRAYGDTGYIFTSYAPFIGPQAYPPGLPLTLVPILAVVGASPPVLRALMVVSALVFVSIVIRYFARESLPLGAAVGVLLGAALELSYATNSVMSDLGLCAFVWGIILAADAPGRWSASRIALVTLLGLCAVSYRVAGVALVPALLLFAVVRYRDHGVRPAVPVLMWGGMLLVLYVALPVSGDLTSYASFRPRWLFERMVDQAVRYRIDIFGSQLYPLPWNAWNDVYHVVASLLMVIGLAVWIRGARRSFLAAFALAYGAMLLVIPVADGRYLWPLYPLLIYGLLNGVRTIAMVTARSAVAARAPWVAFGFASVIAVLAIAMHLREPRPPGLLEQPDVQDLFTQLQARHGRTPLRVVFVNPRVLTLETGIPAMGTFNAGSVDAGMEELRRKRITHIVLGDDWGFEFRQRGILMLLAACADSFQVEYRNPSFVVYRLAEAVRAPPPP